MAVVWPVNLSTNAGRTDGRANLCTPIQSASGDPYVDTVANLASNQGVIFSQGMRLVDGGPWPFEISPFTDDARINEEASSLVQLSPHTCPLYCW